MCRQRIELVAGRLGRCPTADDEIDAPAGAQPRSRYLPFHESFRPAVRLTADPARSTTRTFDRPLRRCEPRSLDVRDRADPNAVAGAVREDGHGVRAEVRGRNI